MRFYLDPSTASAFRRCFVRPMVQTKFPKAHRTTLREAWVDGPSPYIDGAVCEDKPKFAAWLARRLITASRNHTFANAFRDLSRKVDALRDRSIVDRLGDLAREGEQSEKIVNRSLTVRQKALRHKEVDEEDDQAQALDHLLGAVEMALEDLLP